LLLDYRSGLNNSVVVYVVSSRQAPVPSSFTSTSTTDGDSNGLVHRVRELLQTTNMSL